MKIAPIHFLATLVIAVSIFTFPACKKDIAGCTDPQSASYNAEATMDDGSCQYRGCTDPLSETYDAKATIDDGSCDYKGCTDSNSLTYDPKATIDDGTCTYARDAFISTYNATETCNGSINTAWSMTISAATSGDVSQVTISNLGDYGLTFDATVTDDKLTFDIVDSGTGISVVGSGTLTGNQIAFTYKASNSIAEDNCTGTAIKQ